MTDDSDGKKKRKKVTREVRREAGKRAAPAAPQRPPVQQYHRSYAPPKPQRQRQARPRPRQAYDMRTLCAASKNVTGPGIVDLCREAYGRSR
ncbi:hypothetical protein PUR49_02870 [Streptomyces sp. BE147]|uniref:hypothetical protein n=1 Tax=Streptomyces sp. BE147 TaxID=3002524 RepID=UPI002E799016|nr:hypothetical protein [Streptomyces sp. BE147]MEE1735479.1 hypothetical protein [Streptomyces sp. BE147]